MKPVKTKLLSVGICIVLTFAVVLAIKGSSYFFNFIEDIRGYDYGPKIAKGYDWIGPKDGEVIDLLSLRDENGVSIANKTASRLILLTVVDPSCPACKETADQFQFLNNEVKKIGVNYYIVCFSPKVQAGELSEYKTSLNLDTESMSWSNDFSKILPSIKAIAFPSHILVDSKGIVIKTFPGTSNETRIRDRMVRQVFYEVKAESDRRSEPTR